MHKSKEGSSCENLRSLSTDTKEKSLKEAIVKLEAVIEQKTADTRTSQRSPSSKRSCYKCGEFTHLQRNCPLSTLQSPKKVEHSNEKDSPQKLFKIGSPGGKVIKVPVHINTQQTEEFVKNSELHYSGSKMITTLLNAENNNKMEAVSDVEVRIAPGSQQLIGKYVLSLYLMRS